MQAFGKLGRSLLLAGIVALVIAGAAVAGSVDVLVLVAGIVAVTFLALGVIFTIVQRRLFGDPAALARLEVEGMPATATLNEVQGTSGRVGADPIMKLDLTVNLQSVVLRSVVPVQHVSRLQPGASLPVKVDPGDASLCIVDWAQLGATR